MATYLLVMTVGAVVLLAVWRWDERARRIELRRRRDLRLMRTGDIQNRVTSDPDTPLLV